MQANFNFRSLTNGPIWKWSRLFSKTTTRNGNHASMTVKNNIAVLKLNSPGKVNVLNQETQEEVQALVKQIEGDHNIMGTVLISGKPGCFIAGADITMIEKAQSPAEASELSRGGQQFMNQLEHSRKPYVAAIQGSCLGGGLEVALACHYRIAVNDNKTAVGLPEVMLGLLPGAGGTQRLPKYGGIPTALDMMLTGRSLKANRAKKAGIFDQTIDSLGPGLKPAEERTLEYLEELAIKIAYDLATGSMKPNRIKKLQDRLLAYALTFDFVKNQVFSKAKAKVMKASKGLYPAPLRILEVVRVGMDKGALAGYQAEATAFGELACTPESRGLITLFHGQTECKKNKFGKPARPVQNIAVLGAGLMGAGIVHVSADKGRYNVILKDANEKGLTRGYNQINSGLVKAKKRKRLTGLDQEQILSSISFQLDYNNFDKVDMIIEAVFEDLELKQRIIKEAESKIRENCIFASNTSALPISKLAAVSSRPHNVIGMHYFSPVDKMLLLEIIATPKTSKETIASAVQVGLKQGKVVITVGDGPGFYTTRILSFMMAELLLLLQEGVDPKKLDALTTQFGFPVGVCTLGDEVGLDVAAHIVKDLGEAFGARAGGGSPLLIQDMVAAGNLGRKSGKGIFMYDGQGKGRRPVNPSAQSIMKKHRSSPKIDLNDEDILMRMVTRFLNEAVLCLQERILFNPLEGDIGAVFGLGFPPFTGGPFHYIDRVGADTLVDQMRKYEAAYGETFTPCQLLQDFAKDSSKKFFPKNAMPRQTKSELLQGAKRETIRVAGMI